MQKCTHSPLSLAKILQALTILFLPSAVLAQDANQSASLPVKVFILAGQSNMEGQAVVDLKGKDYNYGKGTLESLMQTPETADMFRHLRDANGKWSVRDDVWVYYQREAQPLLAGPLTLGYSVYGDSHHFGPELQFGHVVGDYLENPVLLVKTAWGGKSLYQDFRPPSSGGEVGKYYTLMIAQVRQALARMEREYPQSKGRGHELAGFVWYHGWNDGVGPQHAVAEYEQNLVHLINDVRQEFETPALPVVIGELTGPWVQASGAWDDLRKAQAAVAGHPEFAGNVAFVPTHDFVRKPEDSPNPGHGHHEFGNAETYFLVGEALGKGMLSLLDSQTRPQLSITSPAKFQVLQRSNDNSCPVTIAGTISGSLADAALAPDSSTPPAIEARIFGVAQTDESWHRLDATWSNDSFTAQWNLPAGGWYTLNVRAVLDNSHFANCAVEHVGVGEVFVVAGQSNSANHGAEKQMTQTGKVSAFDGMRWQIANDPQPGASGTGGSFLPPLGDRLADALGVPIGFVACGIGATSIREWLPKGTTFPNPPTLENRVRQLADGHWESNGQAYEMFVSRLRSIGPAGFRAVLWHQGESDANQKDESRTLPGSLYREYLKKLILHSQRDSGWPAPWFVAQVSYHAPGDAESTDIRAAQASLWKDGIAMEGPDSDALKGELRDNGGQGVHFSGPGLRAHAALWEHKLAPWIQKQLH
jgi:hypothetical protein